MLFSFRTVVNIYEDAFNGAFSRTFHFPLICSSRLSRANPRLAKVSLFSPYFCERDGNNPRKKLSENNRPTCLYWVGPVVMIILGKTVPSKTFDFLCYFTKLAIFYFHKMVTTVFYIYYFINSHMYCIHIFKYYFRHRCRDPNANVSLNQLSFFFN